MDSICVLDLLLLVVLLPIFILRRMSEIADLFIKEFMEFLRHFILFVVFQGIQLTLYQVFVIVDQILFRMKKRITIQIHSINFGLQLFDLAIILLTDLVVFESIELFRQFDEIIELENSQ